MIATLIVFLVSLVITVILLGVLWDILGVLWDIIPLPLKKIVKKYYNKIFKKEE